MAVAKRSELPDDLKDIWDEMLMKVDNNISFASVILSDENKEKYSIFMKEQAYKERLQSFGLDPINRLFLFGASGTGKTFSLKAISNELNITMIYVDIAKSLTDGNVSMNVSNIFKLGNYIAENYGGCMIFMDEVDAIVMSRDSNSADKGDIRRATNSIFQQLDQMNPNAIFACASNLRHRIDAAFDRRMSMKMEFKRPDLDMDECIRHFMYPKFIINDDVEESVREIVKRRAKNNVRLSYYEIEELIKRAMKRSVLSDTNIVNTSDIYNDLAASMNFKVKLGTEQDSQEIFEDPKYY